MVFDHLLILLIAPPFFVGVINRVKSIFAGRKGPSLFQLYFDIIKLFRKNAVYSGTTSMIFRLVPVVVLVSMISSGMMLPMLGVAPFHFYGDIVLFVYFLALARFAMILASFDVGSSFEGMGASREAMFGAFSELTVFAGLAIFVILSRFVSLTDIFHWKHVGLFKEPALVFLFFTFFFVLLTENSRMPVDDPNTHLELTMVHEVMILDHSGPDLGILLYASSIKLFIFMVLTVLIVFPNANMPHLAVVCFLLLKIFVMSIIIGIVESVTARIRLIKVPLMLVSSFVLTVFALLIALIERGSL